MRNCVSLGMGAAAAAIVTHGAVYSAMYLNQPLPPSTYLGFFQQVALAAERWWSYAHGCEPTSHIRDFGWFYAPMVQFLCPLVGFVLFWMLSRTKVGFNLWKPIAIALLLTIPSGYSSLVPSYLTPSVEAVRTGLIVLLMAWSVGAVRLRMPQVPCPVAQASASI